MKLHMRITLFLWPFFIGSGLVFGYNWIERSFFPVVADFQVLSMHREANALHMSGVMRKVRNCQFAGVSATGTTGQTITDLQVSFDDRENRVANFTRATGSQKWGPWTVWLPITPDTKTVTLTAAHRCHPAWMTETELITMDLEAL